MKKKIIAVTVASMLFGGAVGASGMWGMYKGNDIVRLTVDGDPVQVSDVPAINYNGRTMVPIYLLRQAGVNFTWDDETKTVNIITEPMITTQTMIQEEVQVREDQGRFYELSVDRLGELQVSYKVKSGPGIDVYFVDEDNFYRWKRSMEESIWDKEFRYFEALSSYGTTLSNKKAMVEAGKYYLILDNSDFGDTVPPMNLSEDVATLDVNVTLK